MKTFLKVIAETAIKSAATIFGMLASMVVVGKAIDVCEKVFNKSKKRSQNRRKLT